MTKFTWPLTWVPDKHDGVLKVNGTVSFIDSPGEIGIWDNKNNESIQRAWGGRFHVCHMPELGRQQHVACADLLELRCWLQANGYLD